MFHTLSFFDKNVVRTDEAESQIFGGLSVGFVKQNYSRFRHEQGIFGAQPAVLVVDALNLKARLFLQELSISLCKHFDQ